LIRTPTTNRLTPGDAAAFLPHLKGTMSQQEDQIRKLIEDLCPKFLSPPGPGTIVAEWDTGALRLAVSIRRAGFFEIEAAAKTEFKEVLCTVAGANMNPAEVEQGTLLFSAVTSLVNKINRLIS
jgi:hypothetical protein